MATAGPQICGRVQSSLRSFFTLPSSASRNWFELNAQWVGAPSSQVYPPPTQLTQLGGQNSAVAKAQIEARLHSRQLAGSGRGSRVAKCCATEGEVLFISFFKRIKDQGSLTCTDASSSRRLHGNVHTMCRRKRPKFWRPSSSRVFCF